MMNISAVFDDVVVSNELKKRVRGVEKGNNVRGILYNNNNQTRVKLLKAY